MQKAGGYPPPYVKSRTRSASRRSKSMTLLHRRIEASSQAPRPASIISAICASDESNIVLAITPARVFIFSHKRRFIQKLPPPITDDGSIYFPLPILKKRFKNGFMIRGLFQITTFIKIPPSIFLRSLYARRLYFVIFYLSREARLPQL